MSFIPRRVRPKTGRNPQNVSKVPFKEEWPMALKNHVSTRRGRESEVPCLTQTFAFITCLKDKNNVQELCSAEAKAVSECYANYLAKKEAIQKQVKAAGDFVPGMSVKSMDPVQMNKFLSHFPHKLKR